MPHADERGAAAAVAFRATNIGQRRYWQDRDVTADAALPDGTRARVAAVFDGHGTPETGEAVADLLRVRFLDVLLAQAHWGSAGGAVRSAAAAVAQLEDEANALSRQRRDYFGSTLCAALVMDGGREVMTVNVGDSRAVAASGVWDGVLQARDLTVDHRPTLAAERDRIEAAGGWVSRELMLNGYVGTSRGIGDNDLKEHRNVTAYKRPASVPADRRFTDQLFIATPDIDVHRVSRDDHFIVLATDGIWHVMSSAEAVAIAHKALHTGARDPAKSLIRAALARHARDNLTVLVIPLTAATREMLATSSVSSRLKGKGKALFSRRKNAASHAASSAKLSDDDDSDYMSDSLEHLHENPNVVLDPAPSGYGTPARVESSLSAAAALPEPTDATPPQRLGLRARMARRARSRGRGENASGVDDLSVYGAHNYPPR